jgi:hypothetical protein
MIYEECSHTAYHHLQVLITSSPCSMNIEMSTVEVFQSATHMIGQVLDYIIVPTITLNSYK